MADLVKVFAVAAKTETVRLTDSVPTLAANAVRVVGPPVVPRVSFLETNERRDAQSGRLGSEGRAASAGRHATVSISCECHGLGATYAGPTYVDQDPLFRACGFSRALVGTAPSDHIDYTSADAAVTCTIYVWAYGKLHILVGCVGTFTITFAAGRVAMVVFEMTGVLAADPTTAAPGAQTLTNVKGAPFTAASLAVGTFDVAAGLQMLGGTFTLGNTVTPMPSAGATDGTNGLEVTDRAPTLALTMFSPLLSAYDVYAKARSGSDAVTMSWGTPTSAGVPPYNGQTLALAAWEPGAPDPGDQGGIGTFALSGAVKHSAGARDVIYSTR